MGGNSYGQLGDGTTTDSLVPQASLLNGVVAVAAGYDYSLALKADGTLWSVGSNFAGQLGNGTYTDQTTPAPVTDLVQAVSAGGFSSFYLAPPLPIFTIAATTHAAEPSTNGSFTLTRTGNLADAVEVFLSLSGNATSGVDFAIPASVTIPAGDASASFPVTVIDDSALEGLEGVIITLTADAAYLLGGEITATVMIASLDDAEAGALVGAGSNASGELGTGDTTASLLLTGATGAGASGVVAVAAGTAFSLFLKADGSLWGMGRNDQGQLGDGIGAGELTTPVAVAGAGTSGVVTMAAGQRHSLFLKTDGSLWAMGTNDQGQLGDGTTEGTYTPVAVIGAGTSGVVAVAAGLAHSLFLKADGSLWAMGYNDHGQLGDGSTTNRSTPIAVVAANANGVIAVAGGFSHSAFLKADGSMWSMGYNIFGQLGDGTTVEALNPVVATGAASSGVVAVAAKGYHTLFIKADTSLWAVGYGGSGQLGDGAFSSSPTPTPVIGAGNGVSAVTAGEYTSLFLKPNGEMWAMGNNADGQLGNNSTTDSAIPLQVIGGIGIGALAGGSTHTLAVALPLITVASSSNAAEPSTDGSFTLTRTGPTDAAQTVSFTTSGNATAGTDFVAIPGTATFVSAKAPPKYP
jgi:alpha-tubulin suppressor-like RCC1 family protein